MERSFENLLKQAHERVKRNKEIELLNNQKFKIESKLAGLHAINEAQMCHSAVEDAEQVISPFNRFNPRKSLNHDTNLELELNIGEKEKKKLLFRMEKFYDIKPLPPNTVINTYGDLIKLIEKIIEKITNSLYGDQW